ncbi:MAG: VOC family protein [Alphaproteobacteria bacterium]|nr:VOC family protein [Alphaproteobacteria bacterium]
MTEQRGRGIDHIVLAVRDLETARARFASFGFTVTPPAVHPFGTGNSLVQLSSSFVELLTVVAPENIVPMAADHFSFSRYSADFLERREGMVMLVLISGDARADNDAWRERGLRTYEPVDFSRLATRADGTKAEVAFTLAFAIDPTMPEAGFFVCQQHRPENFWQPVYQDHRNGANQIVGVTMTAPEPARHADFFRAFVPEAELSQTAGRLIVELPRGRIEVLDRPRLAERFPAAIVPRESATPSFVASTIAVADPAAVATCLAAAGVPYQDWGDGIVIAASHCFEMALEFVPLG